MDMFVTFELIPIILLHFLMTRSVLDFVCKYYMANPFPHFLQSTQAPKRNKNLNQYDCVNTVHMANRFL